MTDQIPPEPPDGALVVIKRKRPHEKPMVLWVYQRKDYYSEGSERWHPIGGRGPVIDWPTLWDDPNAGPNLYHYVATEFVDLWRYNGMEPPK